MFHNLQTSNRWLAWFLLKSGHPVFFQAHGITFYCPDILSMWRADTLLTKEPETLQWIDKMRPGETIADIGASTGIYSLYASLKGLHVYAFETDNKIREILEINIRLNHNLPGKITVFRDGRKAHKVILGVNYIKIDVDGPEMEILKENWPVFRKSQSIMIEESPENKDEITAFLEKEGFICKSKEISPMMKGTKWENYRNAIWVNTGRGLK